VFIFIRNNSHIQRKSLNSVKSIYLSMKIIREPLHGDICLSDEEVRVINTYEMQRLRRVKQLGLKHLVYPGATHSRFEHSLGTRGLVERIIVSSEIDLTREKKRLLFLAALLHDVSHLCFSHPIEEMEVFPSHEKVLRDILEGKIRDEVREHEIMTDWEIDRTKFLGDDDILDSETREEIWNIFKEDTPYPELKGFLDNYIDADNLDYIQRDAFHLGLPSINPDPRIYSAFRLGIDTEGQSIVVFADERAILETIENILNARWYLYKIAYLHHTVMVAESMLREAIDTHWKKGKDVDFLYILGDDELLYKLRKSENMSDEGRYLIHRLMMRDLYSRVYLLNNLCSQNAKEKVDELERISHKRSDFKSLFDNVDVLLTFSRKDPFKEFGKIKINESEPVHILTKMLGEIRILEEKYRDLWTFIVSISTNDYTMIKKYSTTCREYFRDEGAFRPEPIEAKKDRTNQVNLLRKVLNKIRNEKEASLRVLETLCRDEEVTTQDIMELTGLSRSTVSQYLNYLREIMRDSNLQILRVRLYKKIKYWYIEDEKIRKFILRGESYE